MVQCFRVFGWCHKPDHHYIASTLLFTRGFEALQYGAILSCNLDHSCFLWFYPPDKFHLGVAIKANVVAGDVYSNTSFDSGLA